MMRPRFLFSTRPLTLAALLGAMAFLNSCKMPPRQAWQQIQNDGLISYMGADPLSRQIDSLAQMDTGRPTEFLDNYAWMGTDDTGLGSGLDLDPLMVRPEPRIAPTPTPLRTARPVPGQPGYVYSPHGTGKVVSVRRFAAGQEVRCPHTGRPFIVPDFSAGTPELADRSVAREREKLTFDPRANTTPRVVENRPPDRGVAQPKPAPKPVTVKPDGLTATRVPGKANQVFSPYASKRQIVDVTGLKPGEKARCPYTNRVFVVPAEGGLAANNKKPSEVAKITDGIDFKVLGDDKPGVAAGGDKRPASPPIAKWSKKSGYVQSPFGGQLVDVRGKKAGSTVRCPFSGKLFRVPPGAN